MIGGVEEAKKLSGKLLGRLTNDLGHDICDDAMQPARRATVTIRPSLSEIEERLCCDAFALILRCCHRAARPYESSRYTRGLTSRISRAPNNVRHCLLHIAEKSEDLQGHVSRGRTRNRGEEAMDYGVRGARRACRGSGSGTLAARARAVARTARRRRASGCRPGVAGPGSGDQRGVVGEMRCSRERSPT